MALFLSPGEEEGALRTMTKCSHCYQTLGLSILVFLPRCRTHNIPLSPSY
jgi:hypothetical protein